MKPVHLSFLFAFLIINFPSTPSSKSVIEPCNSSDTCPSLLSYVLPWDSKLSEIASRFQVNLSTILGTNSLDPLTPDQILPKNSLLKLPLICSCVDGIRRSVSTLYVVRAADSVESIAKGFGGLVSAEQIRRLNGIDEEGLVMSVERIAVPLPCSCFSNRNNGVATVYMSYVVQRGESLKNVAREFGTTVMELEAVNGLGDQLVDPGDILALPIPACTSEKLNWLNESLMVPNASYALTANNCIKCSCGLTDLNLYCSPSGLATSCSNLVCKDTNLVIGDTYEFKTPLGCNVITCLYRGHLGGKIFRSLSNSSQMKCPGNQSHFAASPASQDHYIPIIAMSPTPTPTTISNSSLAISDQPNPTSSETSDYGRSCPSLDSSLYEFLVLLYLSHLLVTKDCLY